MMKTIILPTDFSDSARNAEIYALDTFDKNEYRFLLLNCWQESYPFIDSLISISDILKEESQKSLNLEKDFLEKMYPGINVETLSQFGVLAQVLVKLIEREKIELIIMGTKGASGLKEVFVGSNTSSVIQKVRCPVIAVPLISKFTKPSRIVFTTDFGNINNLKLITPLLEIAKRYHSTILILNLLNEKEENPSKNIPKDLGLHQLMNNIEHSYYNVENGDIFKGIEKFIEDKKPDMLALLTKKQSFWKNILQSDITRNLVHHTYIPLLTMHDSDLDK